MKDLNENHELVFQTALDHYGIAHQMGKLVEECGELLVEVGKVQQGRGNLGHLAGEIVDVLILLEQMQMHYHIGELCDDLFDYKTERLRDRIFAARLAEEMMD